MSQQTVISPNSTVGQLVADRPSRSRLFQKLGIDFCCGGKRPLAEACAEKGVDVKVVIAALEADSDGAQTATSEVDAAAMSLTALADHIERTHHAYVRAELPRLEAMVARVASVHGQSDPRLTQIPPVFDGLKQEMYSHMMKEEQILFPMCRQMESAAGPVGFHCGSIANPIRVMEMEHEHAGNALSTMRRLTDDFTPPAHACNTYRAMLAGLAEFEADLHQHVHKENNVLFPRAMEMEKQLAVAPATGGRA